MEAAGLSGVANGLAVGGDVPAAVAGGGGGGGGEAARLVEVGGRTLPNGAGLDLAGPGVDDAGENRRATSVIWQWVDASTQAVVWPPAFATRPLQAIPIQ